MRKLFSALQIIFCTKKQDLIIRKCSDKSTYLRADKAHLGCGTSPRIREISKTLWLGRTATVLLGLLFLVACSSTFPPDYYDYEYERDYKVGIISDRLIQKIPPDIKRPAVLVVTSFVQLDDFSRTSRFGMLMAEQLLSRLAGRGFLLRETRMKDIFYQSPGGEFVLSREFSKVAQELDARLVLLGTYLEARDHVLVNTRLVDFQKQAVVASYDCQLVKTPDIVELLSR